MHCETPYLFGEGIVGQSVYRIKAVPVAECGLRIGNGLRAGQSLCVQNQLVKSAFRNPQSAIIPGAGGDSLVEPAAVLLVEGGRPTAARAAQHL